MTACLGTNPNADNEAHKATEEALRAALSKELELLTERDALRALVREAIPMLENYARFLEDTADEEDDMGQRCQLVLANALAAIGNSSGEKTLETPSEGEPSPDELLDVDPEVLAAVFPGIEPVVLHRESHGWAMAELESLQALVREYDSWFTQALAELAENSANRKDRPMADPNTCRHPTARRGPGSALAWVTCTECGKALGVTVPVDVALVRLEQALISVKEAVMWREHELSGTRIPEDE
jgi:hypothetical protein